jgi:hypothetical protein
MKDDPRLNIEQDVPYMEALLGALKSKFCFVPRGKSAWSSRFFQVFFYECVLVLLNDFYEAPFTEILDSTEFMIKWPMTKVDESLLSYLESLTLEQMERLVENARQVRCWYVYPPSRLEHSFLDLNKLRPICPEFVHENAYAAIHRLLARKVRATKAGPLTFFRPIDGRIQLLDADHRFV